MRIVKFTLISGIGFAVNASILYVATLVGRLSLQQAMLPSFSVAMLVTWLLNRTWTFNADAATGATSIVGESGRYLLVQVAAAATNLMIFHSLIPVVEDSVWKPLELLFLGALGSLLVSYSGSRAWVFKRSA